MKWPQMHQYIDGWLFIDTIWERRYPLSYRDIEELFLERGLAVDHSTLNRWVLAYAPLIERRLRAFRKPHCGSVRIDETYIKIRGQWRYLYRAIDKHGVPVDFLWLSNGKELGPLLGAGSGLSR
jgi:transposase-like protein